MGPENRPENLALLQALEPLQFVLIFCLNFLIIEQSASKTQSIPQKQKSKSGANRNLRMADREHRKRSPSICYFALGWGHGEWQIKAEEIIPFSSLCSLTPLLRTRFGLKEKKVKMARNG